MHTLICQSHRPVALTGAVVPVGIEATSRDEINLGPGWNSVRDNVIERFTELEMLCKVRTYSTGVSSGARNHSRSLEQERI